MISALSGMALGTIGAITGAVASARANTQAQETLANSHKDTQKYYDTQLAQDYTQRADVQSVLTKQKELLADEYRKARARNIVSGGTDESLALMQQGANNTLTDTMRGIASNAVAHKDQLSAQKLASNQQYALQQANLQQQRGQNIANAASQLGKMGGSMIAGDNNTWKADKENWSFLFGKG